jgi:SAM-dependent methyltransferase
MTGADLKPEYIASANASAAQAGVSVRFAVSDMREFASEDTFDAAFCYFGSFGYFPEEGDLRFVQAVSNMLKPGGRFLVEGHIMETLLPIFRERDWHWAGSPEDRVRVLEERRWNMEAGRVEVTWTVADDRGTGSVDSSMRIYAYRELRALLERADFVNVRALDAKTGRPFQMGACRALIVAEKQG